MILGFLFYLSISWISLFGPEKKKVGGGDDMDLLYWLKQGTRAFIGVVISWGFTAHTIGGQGICY
jgi:hypothetical protein